MHWHVPNGARTQTDTETRPPNKKPSQTADKRYVDETEHTQIRQQNTMHTIPTNFESKPTKTKSKFKLAAFEDTMETPFTHESPLIITGKWDELFDASTIGTLSANSANFTDKPAKNAGIS